MHDTGTLILLCKEVLQIKKPVEIKLLSKGRGKSKELAGYCQPRFRKGKVIGYLIVLNLDMILLSEYKLNDVIAHELIHAAQFEHEIFDNEYHHDKKFQGLARVIKKHLNKAGFEITEIYNKKTDTS